MKAFLSHSSADREFVEAVYSALIPDCLWLDRAEIEWGDRFVDEISEGIRNATDFVLFWSASAAASEWVRIETHMAFLRSLESRAIRFRIVRLDNTELPLHLRPFQYLRVRASNDAVGEVVSTLRTALGEPTRGVRHRFFDRNSELERIEAMVNDHDTRVVFLQGFQGIGKTALANEALRRFFQGSSAVTVPITSGTGPAELALKLHHVAFGSVPPEVSGVEALALIEKAVEHIAGRGQFIILRDCQHWLDDEQRPQEPLPTVIRQAKVLAETAQNPLFMTSTRRPRVPADLSAAVSFIRVGGLPTAHTASVIGLWYEMAEGQELAPEAASKVAAEVHGHPVAAKLAANLIGQYGVEHLLQFPRELVRLRRDLAKTLIGELTLRESAHKLLEALAIIGVPIPSRVLGRALGLGDDGFLEAVGDATKAGLAETADHGHLALHPLVAEHFWRSHFSRVDYIDVAARVAAVVHEHLRQLAVQSAGYVAVLQAVTRLYFLSGDIGAGRAVRRDLRGELARAAITHYDRREFELAEIFVQEVLKEQKWNWRMRQYLARIRIRQRRWVEADGIVDGLLAERPGDVGARHLRGWRLLRFGSYEAALDVLVGILAEREHVASMRDGAECLYRLGRTGEALELLERAKKIESDNPYTLDLEARIYEESGAFEKAEAAARVAVIRNPSSWSLRHRLARILNALGRQAEAVGEARESVNLDPAQFVARSTLVSLLLDTGEIVEAETQVDGLGRLAVDKTHGHVVVHLSARLLFQRGDHEGALRLIQRQVEQGANLAASYGLLGQIRLAQFVFV